MHAKEFCIWAKHSLDNKKTYMLQVFQGLPNLKKNHYIQSLVFLLEQEKHDGKLHRLRNMLCFLAYGMHQFDFFFFLVLIKLPLS